MPERNELVEANLKWARAAATKYTLGARRESPEWQDAFSEACVALLWAASEYDPSRGAAFSTFAWPRMMRAIQRLREGEKRRWGFEKQAPAELAPSPEDLLLDAEQGALARERLARIEPAKRLALEALLEGRSVGHARLKPLRLAAEAGLRVPASALPEKTGKLSSAERSKRWYDRLTPEQKEARRLKRSARAGVAA